MGKDCSHERLFITLTCCKWNGECCMFFPHVHELSVSNVSVLIGPIVLPFLLEMDRISTSLRMS